ncbi:bifunctional serine/threonine-protein kinase/formylglycine-generating enzyme family protein [Pyxidicoccus xibeiensis]|uniref:bifunctional serine/threonine-protein kinase/formylglycine-generating enzyme family protein n=1 Tax=Pyxidicoccus xibeiensis TaxID=2906759 RepID=UPI0020A76740|nr:bifunctional serine/threonine-protein kinase/formylglycine-generating enzyme family protein [Pyxidicoccus xibeiensis]MCP3138189.1 protein kinase [Pyxidicoccus xibeiensis]
MRPANASASTADASQCLTDDLLVALLEGRLPDEVLSRVHGHAARCDACRKLLVDVSRYGLPSAGKSGGTGTTPVPGRESPGTPDWTPPVEFDEFRRERLIGRGGMGVVYLAYDRSLERRVAVKFIASSEPEPWVRAYFETEARAIARLQHPNVVTVFRVGKVDGHPYIVSEYVEGRSLAELPVPMPWRRVLPLGVGLARGLAAAHSRGVLHRDLKPSNAILTGDGEVKLLDFGLAERFDDAQGAPEGPKLVVGTLPYMAPELLARAPATPRSDLYALGLILRELCTGEAPRKGVAPGALGPEVDPDFAAIIARCLAPNPLERFASADALCEALERLERISAPAPLVDGNPYRGLAPFEAEHRALFFGRDADIRAVLERLRHRPFVLVAGDSGAGKSSLCRAGIVPRVAAGALDDGRERATVTLWPGRYPIEALAAALAPVLGRKEAELVVALTDSPAGFGRTLREVRPGGRGLLLCIDQLEELITLSEPVQAERLARLLGELALPSEGVRVLLAVRGDFLTRVCVLPGLGDEAERALYILRPMSPDNVREAIVGPARSRGVVFESEELVQALVASTAHGAGGLPLLQFALAELWERRSPAEGRITHASLAAMGGVAGALSRHADGMLARLSPSEREAARRLLLQLVTAEGTRIERGEDELVDVPDEASRAALRALVEGRLLHVRTAGGQPRYEIAHDSLIGSWGTLRGWLDDDIGHRALRKRVEAASAEWVRLLRAPEALWGQRQLDESRPLTLSSLGPRERDFLLASRHAVARARWGRWLGVLAVVLAAGASYGGLRLQAHLEDSRFIAARTGSAREALVEGRGLAARAAARREEALALFDGRPSAATSPEALPIAGLRDVAEQRWEETLALRDQADAAYVRASQTLEKALDRDRGHAGTRELLAEVAYERVLLAERFLQPRAHAERMQHLEQVAEAGPGAQWLQRLQVPAEVSLVTDPPDARVELARYTDVQGQRRREPVPGMDRLTATSMASVRLPAGSYHLRFSHPGRAPVDLPLLLSHGAREPVRVTLPAAVPEGYAYVPPGCLLLGSGEPEEVRGSMLSPPLHRFCLGEGYLIGRTEVTFGDWLAYLDDLPEGEPARRLLEQPRFSATGAVTLRKKPGEGWVFSFYRSLEDVFTAKVGEPFHNPARARRHTADWQRFPLTGVSAVDLEGYFFWLDRTGRLPGARLCSEHEWEFAARGADGRRYPHGDRLLPDDANIDTTYDRQPLAFGPDMVGEHPASVSPFGLMDVSGNAYELVRSLTPELGRVAIRGGGFYYDSFAAHIANIGAGDPTQRDASIGVRVCASFTPR